jgi:repressor LexA
MKTIERGNPRTQVNLTSFNAKPIQRGEAGIGSERSASTQPRGQIERLRAKAGAGPGKSGKKPMRGAPRKISRPRIALGRPIRAASPGFYRIVARF